MTVNEFKIGDWVTWKYGDGKPTQIIHFDRHKTHATLSFDHDLRIPLHELTPAKESEPVATDPSSPVVSSSAPDTSSSLETVGESNQPPTETEGN